MDLREKVVWITGGARMGQTVAEELAKRGCHVALSYNKSKKAASETARRVETHGSRALLLKADLRQSSAARLSVKKIVKTLGRLDILINMASLYESTPLSSLNPKTWSRTLQSNLDASFFCSFYSTPFLKKSKGRIINFSDWVVCSQRPRYKNLVPYHTAKSGIEGLTRSLALELAPQVLVNAIAPGPILPPRKWVTPESKMMEKVTPLKKWGGSMEIFKAVLFLIDSDFVTGEILRVDGGRHLI